MELTVKTESGLVEGLYSKDKKCLIFRGVPYAEPPVGELRFKRSVPKKPWEGVRPAKAFSPKAYQADMTKDEFYCKEFYSGDTVPMSEDCLYLNIWTPADTGNEKLPVLMWIHGGAYMHGYGSEDEFDGENFAAKGVIMVSINYRVGALGFFAHDELEKENDEGISGNYGMWDQIRALEWIYDNIENFGGDKNRITVCGQSAGCMSTQTLISSDITRGKINSAILQSGGGIPGFARDYNVDVQKKVSLALMKHLGVSTIGELRELSPEAICYGAYAIGPQFDGLCFMPNVDGYLLKDTIPNLAEKGLIHDIPYMIGCTKDEMGGGSADILRQSAINFGKNQEKLGKKTPFIYHFTRQLPGDKAGAFHSSELWYVFATYKRCWRPFTEEDIKLADIISSYWANFIKKQDPNDKKLTEWRAYSSENPVRMKLDTLCEEEKAE